MLGLFTDFYQNDQLIINLTTAEAYKMFQFAIKDPDFIVIQNLYNCLRVSNKSVCLTFGFVFQKCAKRVVF